MIGLLASYIALVAAVVLLDSERLFRTSTHVHDAASYYCPYVPIQIITISTRITYDAVVED